MKTLNFHSERTKNIENVLHSSWTNNPLQLTGELEDKKSTSLIGKRKGLPSGP